MASPPSPQALLGPYYFGVMANVLLFGILVVQTINYYQGFKRDRPWLRFFVLYLFVVETLNTGMCVAMIYEPLVAQFGTSSPTFLFPSLLPSQPFLEAAIFVPVQFFYAWRISVIMRNYFVPSLICLTSLTALVGAIWTAIIVAQVKNYGNKAKVDTTALVWSVCASTADVMITVSLFWSLMRRKTGLKGTDDTIDSIARHAIQTGLLTVTVSILDVSLFVALPNSTLSFFFDFALPKLYSNSLVSTLNARGKGEGGGIIELDTPSSVYTGSTTVRTRQTNPSGLGSVTFAHSSAHHKVSLDSDDILGLSTGGYPDPK